MCGVGVAYEAKVGGIRMLDGDVTDAVEAGSLSYRPDHIDIYSSSWGPDDDGRSVDGPGPLAKKAFSDGIKGGRLGRGSIFVWATGNGGRFADYCSCDGYINSPYTISIGAVDNCGRKPWYAEQCPGTFAVTYSSGESSGRLDKQISTTDLRHRCTSSHTGTSAAAPLAAGIFALVLQANPKLTWRDLQHLVANTSKVVSPDDREWQKNGAGHMVNPKFGFGALDSGKLVELAMSSKWKTARPYHTCTSEKHQVNLALKPGKAVTNKITTDACALSREKCVTRLEHVRVFVTIESKAKRGDLEIFLKSPQGTKSPILKRRVRDTAHDGFKNWAFLTVFNWGEQPEGDWELTLTGGSDPRGVVLKEWSLELHGTCHPKKTNDLDIDINIKDEEICDEVCKKGCPKTLAHHCFECTQFCDCTIGKCVPSCDATLVEDHDSYHCKRSMNDGSNNLPSNKHFGKATKKKSSFGIALSSKFAIICLGLIAVSVLVGGVAYFASKMPANPKDRTRGYHSVSRYPCTDAGVEVDGEGDNLTGKLATIKS